MQGVKRLGYVCAAECEEVRWHGRLLRVSRHCNKMNYRAPAWIANVARH